MQSDWKGVVILLLSWFAIVSSQKGAVTFGFNVEVFSRGGLTVGYFVSDDMSLEIHANGIPHFFTCGMSLKYQPLNNNNNFYLISGIATLLSFSHYRDSLSNTRSTESIFIGLNAGCGYEVNIKNNRWKLPLEGGVFLPLWGIRKKYTTIPVTGMWLNKEEVRKGWFPIPFLGYGITWYSQTE